MTDSTENTYTKPKNNRERKDRIKKSKREYAAKHKGTYKTLSITQKADQTERDRATLAANGTTVLRVWRAAVDALPIQPTAPTVSDNRPTDSTTQSQSADSLTD